MVLREGIAIWIGLSLLFGGLSHIEEKKQPSFEDRLKMYDSFNARLRERFEEVKSEEVNNYLKWRHKDYGY